MKALLKELGLQHVNASVYTRSDGWILDPQGEELISYNPATGESVARVIQGTAAVYETVVQGAHAAFKTWRHVPAPKRGLVIRDLVDALAWSRRAFPVPSLPPTCSRRSNSSLLPGPIVASPT
jgi:aldehyde dehydrogenase (NAD+)